MTAFVGEPKSEAVRAVMRANTRRDTRPELRLRAALHRKGYRYRVDYEISGFGRKARADLAFLGAKVAIFVDGCFWHRCPDHGVDPKHNAAYWQVKLDGNVRRDNLVTQSLQTAGWRVLRIWEHTPVDGAVALVRVALEDTAFGPPPRAVHTYPSGNSQSRRAIEHKEKESCR